MLGKYKKIMVYPWVFNYIIIFFKIKLYKICKNVFPPKSKNNFSRQNQKQVFPPNPYKKVLPPKSEKQVCPSKSGKRPISTPEVSYSNSSTRSFNLVLVVHMRSLTTYFPPIWKFETRTHIASVIHQFSGS